MSRKSSSSKKRNSKTQERKEVIEEIEEALSPNFVPENPIKRQIKVILSVDRKTERLLQNRTAPRHQSNLR